MAHQDGLFKRLLKERNIKMKIGIYPWQASFITPLIIQYGKSFGKNIPHIIILIS